MSARMLMPTRHKVLTGQTLFASLALLSVTGCVQTDNLSLASATSSSEYLGTTFRTNPSITFTGRDGSPLATLNDLATVEAFQDADCVIPAAGTVSAASNPVPLVAGTASFSSFMYTPTRWQPTDIYLRITVKKQGLTKCLSATSLGFPSFGNGPLSSQTSAKVGFVTGGTPGDAGAAAANQTDSNTTVLIDANGRYVLSGRSRPTDSTPGTPLSTISVRRILPTGAKDVNFGPSGKGYSVASTTIGAAGRAGNAMDDMAWAMRIDSQSRIVVAGTSKNTAGGIEMALWRYTDAGNLDSTFSNGGSQYAGSVHSGTTGVAGKTGATQSDAARAMVIDSQGRYLVGGYSANSATGGCTGSALCVNAALWRYNTDGSLDTTFSGSLAGSYAGSSKVSNTGPAGGDLTNGWLTDAIYAMTVASDGKIIAAGSSYNANGRSEMAIWRFDAEGALDTTFNGTGYNHFNTNSTSAGTAGGTGTHGSGACSQSGSMACDIASGIIIDQSGKYVVVGTSRNASGGTEMVVWRYNTDGTIDTTFPSAGLGATSNKLGSIHLGTSNVMGVSDAAKVFNRGMSINLDSSGRYVIAGNSRDWNCTGGSASSYRVMIARINTDGSLDTTFGAAGSGAVSHLAGSVTAYGYDGANGSSANFSAAGQTCASSAMYDVAWSSAIDSFGNIVAGGWSAGPSGSGAGYGWEWVMWRFKSNGAEDK